MPADEGVARTNVIVILADDLGFSDIGCYGGEIATPNLDQLARSGVRCTSFYNTARCSPSRASLLTGRHPHETGIGVLTEDMREVGGYPGTLSAEFPTLAERLKAEGYATCLAGKWHLSGSAQRPDGSWPTRRGFDEFYGIMPGADSYFHPRNLWHGEVRQDVPSAGYYLTGAISEHAASFVERHADEPFFLYLAYTAPHWPLHAPEEDVLPYEERYRRGWDELREARYERLRAEGLLGEEAPLSERDPSQPAWADVEDKDWEARRMAVYAAQVTAMDAGIGTVLGAVRAAGVEDDTLVVFLADNGACAEELPPPYAPHFFERNPSELPDGTPIGIGNRPAVVPGPAATYASYGRSWANLSNTPFRLYKRWVHEGGIATPLVVFWPRGGLRVGSVHREPYQLTDLLPTVMEAVAGPDAGDAAGASMLASLRGEDAAPGHALFWEHVGNAAVRSGRWKAVRESDRPWELYDLARDRSETRDLAAHEPEELARLVAQWQRWADSVGVIPWERLRHLVSTHGG